MIRPFRPALLLCYFVAPLTLLCVCPKVNLQQVDVSSYPNVRVSLLLTDEGGNPLPNDQPIKIALYEGNRLVYVGKTVENGRSLAEGWSVYVVLAIDCSGSMDRADAFPKAQQAAVEYLDAAPKQYNIALVSFSDTAQVESDFTADRALLRQKITDLRIQHVTALQDAVGLSLDLLQNKQGRKSILLLTDGRDEGGSTKYKGSTGFASLLKRATDEQVTVSTIGLGGGVDERALDQYLATNGQKLHAASPSDLRSLFLQSVNYLSKEQVFTYRSPFAPDGRVLRPIPKVVEEGGSCDQVSPPDTRVQAVAPGLLPHVKGNLFPFLEVVVALLILPLLLSGTAATRKVRNFRANSVRNISLGSEYVGIRDANGHVLGVGDQIVLCPECSFPHHVRSWRMNGCSCMRQPTGVGSFCYCQSLPAWLRRALDYLSRHHVSRAGRSWLCRCAGDRDGY